MAANHVVPRGSVKASPLRNAAVVNDILDATDYWKRNRLGDPIPEPPAYPSTDCVKIKNLTGSDRTLGEVLQLGAYLLTTIDKRNLWFEGNAVADPSISKYALCSGPIKSNDIGLAQMSGVCVASINVISTSDKFAAPVTGQSYLKSGSSGPAEILSPLASTGVQLAAVRLQSGSATSVLAKLTGSSTILSPGSSDTFTVWGGALGSEAALSPTQTLTAEARFEPCDKTGFAWLGNNGSGWYVIESEHLALQIGGTLGSGGLTAGGSCAGCNVSWYHNGADPGGTITLYSAESVLSGASGKAFKAHLNRYDGKYYVDEVAC